MRPTRLRWIYFLGALALGGAAFTGATLVDQGFTRGWSEWVRLSWALGLVFSGIVAVAALFAFLSLSKGDVETGRLLFRGLLLGALAFCAFFALGHFVQASTGFAEDRTFLIGIGAFIAICTWRKPWWFWEHPKARFVRDIIGDLPTTVAYYLISAGCVGYGIFGSNPHV